MQKRAGFFVPFLTLIFFSILIFTFSRLGFLGGLAGFFEKGATPFQKFTYALLLGGNNDTAEIIKLKSDNQKLVSQIVNQSILQKENDALRSQFETTTPSSKNLLPASVIGALDTTITIDKGLGDGVKKGMVVVFKDNLVGQISRSSEHISKVDLTSSNRFSTTAKTLKTEALGVAKGQDDSIVLGSVVLSDKLEKDDLVLTKGDVSDKGLGIPPNLVIGKIASIDKKPSNLFQSAEVESLVDLRKTETVFVIIQ